MSNLNIHNLKVGQIVFLEPKTYGRDTKPLEPVEITKIARKYFRVKGYDMNFELETLYEANFGNYKAKVWLNESERAEFLRKDDLRRELRQIFDYVTGKFLTLDQLERIYKIVKE